MKKAHVSISDTMKDSNGLPVYSHSSILKSSNFVSSFSFDARDLFDVLHVVTSYIRGFLPVDDKGRVQGKVDRFSLHGDNSFRDDDDHFFVEVSTPCYSAILRVDVSFDDLA